MSYLRSLLQSPSAFNNWKQQEGLNRCSGSVSDFIRLKRFKNRLTNGITPEVLAIMQELGYDTKKVDYHLTKPFDFSKTKTDELLCTEERSMVHALVFLCSSRKKMEDLSDRIFELLKSEA